MSEQKMIEVVQAAMVHEGIDDEVIAVGEFYPRGHTGGGFVGGMLGGSAGESAGSLAGSIGTVGGYLAGTHASDDASGLPAKMLVAVSPQVVYGFAARTRHEEPDSLAFRVRRDALSVKVHQRVNVRVLELIDEHGGSAIELEGSRVPATHSHDVIRELDR
jgi:hypothetical protein